MEDKIFKQAFDECMEEMYNKAWPSASWKEYIEKAKRGEITKDEKIYERHWLRSEELTYILDKYIRMYGMESKWRDYCDIIIEDLKHGYNTDDHIDDYVDEAGNEHPGYRSYKPIPSLKEQIKEIVEDAYGDNFSLTNDLVNKINEKVIENIKDRRNFYRFDRTEDDFRCAICLGASPYTGEPMHVKEYWESQGINIGEPPFKNPLLLWEYDEYGDEMDEIMTDEYGENWEKIWKQKWEDEIATKEKEHKERYKKYLEEQNTDDK